MDIRRARLRCRWPRASVPSRHSARTDRTYRSKALARGARHGVRFTRGSAAHRGHRGGRLGSRGVEFLQQPVGGTLNLFVSPLGGSVEAGDQATSMKTAEVTVDERISRLGLIGGTIGQPKEPARVVLPGVLLQKGILGCGLRLNVAPVAVQDVSLGLDELASLGHSASIHGV